MKGLPPSRPSSPILPFVNIPPTASLLHRVGRPFVFTLACICAVRTVSFGLEQTSYHSIASPLGSTCEERGMISRLVNATEEASRIVVHFQASPLGEAEPNKINTLLRTPLNPFFTSIHESLFASSSAQSAPQTDNPAAGTSSCVAPVRHLIHMRPPPSLPRDEPTLFFAHCTSPERVVSFAPTWSHHLASTQSAPQGRGNGLRRPPPGCMVVDAIGEGDLEGRRKANIALKNAGTSCIMRDSSRVGERYEMRVLGLVRDAWVEAERRRWEQDGGPVVEWFVIADDDTFFVDISILKEMLLDFDHTEDHLLGGFSEAEGNFEEHKKHFLIAYGGGGLLISRSLMRKMQGLIPRCAKNFAHIFGGDGLISHCAALARDLSLEFVVEEVPGLSQMDMRGDASGFLSSGDRLLTLHHWASWLSLFPNTSGIDAVTLLGRASDLIGGQNMFQRWVFDEGRTVFTAGYSVMVHRDALSNDDLRRVEHTWPDFQPRKPSRGPRLEGKEKFTYFLESIEQLSPSLILFHHKCNHPSLNDTVSRIDILWDTRQPKPWWPFGREQVKRRHRRKGFKQYRV
ncbi:hypothetical protein T439DRAFT_310430 [Meredithblackwellia eburnea MCA 4105]